MAFGSSSELEEYEADAGLSVDVFRAKHGDAFLLIDARFAGDASDSSLFEDATDANIRVVSATTPGKSFVFPVKKRTNTEFNFIAVGRNVGNDLHIPHPSVSRFHAFFRITDKGVIVQDAKSSTGTMLNDKVVPKPNEGEPQKLLPGANLRLGAVVAQYLDAAGLLAALHASGSSGLG